MRPGSVILAVLVLVVAGTALAVALAERGRGDRLTRRLVDVEEAVRTAREETEEAGTTAAKAGEGADAVIAMLRDLCKRAEPLRERQVYSPPEFGETVIEDAASLILAVKGACDDADL